MSAALAGLIRRNPWETLLATILVATVIFNATQSGNYFAIDN